MHIEVIVAQQSTSIKLDSNVNFRDTNYIKRFDTLLHLNSWISSNRMEYTLVYTKDFKMVLAPNKINSFSFGFSYRYLDLGISFTPEFLNKTHNQKGESEQFKFNTSLSIHRFKFSLDLTSVKGFYLKNSADFISPLRDSAYIVFPDLSVGYLSFLLRYNINPKFSTATLVGGTQMQQRTAYTVLPTFQVATFRFHNGLITSGVQNEETYSTDLNLLFPALGTWVIAPGFSATLGIGPSLGVDFFKSVSIDADNKIVLSKGTAFTLGYTLQAGLSYHVGRFFTGFEIQNRRYGHEIEDVSKLVKKYSYFQVYLGMRLKAPHFAKKSLDWINKISPIDFE